MIRWLVLFALVPCSASLLQGQPPPEPADAKVAYDASAAGLTQLFTDLLAATSRKDEKALKRLIGSLKLPRHAEWAKQYLGDRADSFLQEYEQMLPAFDKQVGQVLEARLKEQQTQVMAGTADPKDDDRLSKFQQPVTLYWVRMVQPGKPMGYRIYYFVHEGGTFRFLGKLTMLK